MGGSVVVVLVLVVLDVELVEVLLVEDVLVEVVHTRLVVVLVAWMSASRSGNRSRSAAVISS